MLPNGCAVEVFAGSGTFSRAWRQEARLAGIPIFEVDLRFGPRHNLLRKGTVKILMGLLRAGVIRALWLGTPCNSFTRAREIPNWPNAVPLRSATHPEGLPGLRPHDQLKVWEGNQLARASARLLEAARSLGVPVACENPISSRLWDQPAFVRLLRLPDARWSFTDYCQDGTEWKKRTGFVSFGVDLAPACRHCHCCRGVCSRSGRPHTHVEGRRNGVLMSQLAEPYPFPLCKRFAVAFANGLRETLAKKVARYFMPVDGFGI